jgi:hypothetical protein
MRRRATGKGRRGHLSGEDELEESRRRLGVAGVGDEGGGTRRRRMNSGTL